MIIVDDRTFAEKVKTETARKIDEIKWGAKRAGIWISNHPTEFISLSAALLTAVGFATKGIRGVIRDVNDMADRRDEQCRVWDPVNGIHWHTKHPLTMNQRLEFEKRVAMGENRGAILESMNVLRRR